MSGLWIGISLFMKTKFAEPVANAIPNCFTLLLYIIQHLHNVDTVPFGRMSNIFEKAVYYLLHFMLICFDFFPQPPFALIVAADDVFQ